MKCGKQIFPSAHKATVALANVLRRAKDKSRAPNAYYCEGCEGWHWGHQDARRNKRRTSLYAERVSS